MAWCAPTPPLRGESALGCGAIAPPWRAIFVLWENATLRANRRTLRYQPLTDRAFTYSNFLQARHANQRGEIRDWRALREAAARAQHRCARADVPVNWREGTNYWCRRCVEWRGRVPKGDAWCLARAAVLGACVRRPWAGAPYQVRSCRVPAPGWVYQHLASRWKCVDKE